MVDKHPGGRPTEYEPDFARQAWQLVAENGFSIVKLAKFFSVNRSTIYYWMDNFPEFSNSIRNGRKHYEGQKIHRALAKRATGFRYTEVTKEADADGQLKETKRVTKTVAPDVSAIKHWQANMDPDNWRDKKTIEGNITLNQALSELEAEGRPEPKE